MAVKKTTKSKTSKPAVKKQAKKTAPKKRVVKRVPPPNTGTGRKLEVHKVQSARAVFELGHDPGTAVEPIPFNDKPTPPPSYLVDELVDESDHDFWDNASIGSVVDSINNFDWTSAPPKAPFWKRVVNWFLGK